MNPQEPETRSQTPPANTAPAPQQPAASSQATAHEEQTEQPVPMQKRSWLNNILITLGLMGVGIILTILLWSLEIRRINDLGAAFLFLIYTGLIFPFILILILLGLIGAVKRAKDETHSSPFTVIFLIIFIFLILLIVLYRGAFIFPLISLL